MRSTIKRSGHMVIGIFMLGSMHTGHARLVNVHSDAEYDKLISSNSKPMVVKFSAPWCGACTMAKKPFEELAQEPALSNIDFVNVNIDELQPLATREGIEGIPTFNYIRNGVKIGQTVGLGDPNNIKKQMRTTIKEKLTPQKEARNTSSKQTTSAETDNFWANLGSYFSKMSASISSTVASLFGNLPGLSYLFS